MGIGAPFFAVEAQGVVGAVCKVSAETFAEEPLNQLLTDITRLAPYAVRHEETISTLMAATPALVPMSFGTLYQQPEHVTALLEQRNAEIRALLERLRDKQEWTLKIAKDPKRLLEATERNSDKLMQLGQQAAQATPGRAYLFNKQRDKLQASEAERLLHQALDDIMGPIVRTCVDLRVEDLPAIEPGQAALALKAALLVDTARLNALREAVTAAGATAQPLGLSLEISGPWAPYSFVGTPDGR